MRQIAELFAAEWVVAEVLDVHAAVSIGMRLRTVTGLPSALEIT